MTERGSSLVAISAARMARPQRALLGHLPAFARDPTGFLAACVRERGDLTPLRFGHKRALLVADPNLIDAVLVGNAKHFAKPYVLRTDRLGLRAVGVDENVWPRSQLAQTVFHRAHMPTYGLVMTDAAEQLLDSWPAGATRDVLPDLMRLTLTIVTRALFCTDVTDDEVVDVGHALDVAMDGFSWRLRTRFLIPEWTPTLRQRQMRRAMRRLDEVMDAILERGDLQPDGRGGLATLPLAEHGRDAEQLRLRRRAEALAILLAGHETTALALGWTWQLLAQRPDVDAALQRELQDVLGGRAPTVDDVPRLPYTDAIVREALRLYPPIWVMARVATTATQVGDVAVAPGTLVFVSQWATHRDPRWHAAPDEFRPERWAGDAARQLPRYAYFPFGGGLRGCIGSGFATIEAVLLLATIAQRLRFELAPGQTLDPQPSVTLRPRHGVQAVLRPRA